MPVDRFLRARFSLPQKSKLLYFRASFQQAANVHLLQRLDYSSFIMLMKNCHLILADAGGFKEEAPSLGKQYR
jgi:UDP-N-acetylglucosamine 2-epimerase